MIVCAVCGELIQVAIHHEADMLVHRYFRHGPVSERLVRWGFSIVVGWIAQRVVREALS